MLTWPVVELTISIQFKLWDTLIVLDCHKANGTFNRNYLTLLPQRAAAWINPTIMTMRISILQVPKHFSTVFRMHSCHFPMLTAIRCFIKITWLISGVLLFDRDSYTTWLVSLNGVMIWRATLVRETADWENTLGGKTRLIRLNRCQLWGSIFSNEKLEKHNLKTSPWFVNTIFAIFQPLWWIVWNLLLILDGIRLMKRNWMPIISK